MKRIFFLSIIIVLTLTTFTLTTAGADSTNPTGSYIISVEGDTTADSIDESKQKADEYQEPVLEYLNEHDGIEVRNTLWSSNSIIASINTEQTPIETIENHSQVKSVNTDQQVTQPDPPEDDEPDVGIQSTGDTTYGLEQLRIEETWDEFGVSGDTVKVAVIDTGADIEHEDITVGGSPDNNYLGYWAVFDSGKTEGDDLSSGQEQPFDDDTGHGTHVAGTIAGGDASGTQIGVSPDVTPMHAKALDDGTGSISDMMSAVEWAVENDADVISMSIGVSKTTWRSDQIIDTMRMAYNNDVILVAATGNAGDDTVALPGASGDVISVGGTTDTEHIVSSSGGKEYTPHDYFGNDFVSEWEDPMIAPHVVAPGRWVESAQPETTTGTTTKTGTSMATPHVTGVVSLALENNPELTQTEIEHALQHTAVTAARQPDERNTRQGYGIVDAFEVLKATNPDGYLQPDTVLVNETVDAGDEIHVNASIANANLIGDTGQDDVTLYVNGEEIQTHTGIEIGSDSREYVEFVYITDEDAVESKDITIGTSNKNVSNTTTVRGNSEFEVSISDSPDRFVIDEPSNITVEVENIGEYVDSTTVKPFVDDVSLENNATTDDLSPGESQEFDFEYTASEDDGDTITARFDISTDTTNTTVDVVEPVLFTPQFNETLSEEFVVNETVTIPVDVENIGGVSGSDTVELVVNDSNDTTLIEETPALQPDGNTTVEFEYTVPVDTHPELELTVEASDNQDTRTAPVLLPGESTVEIDSESVTSPIEGEEIEARVIVENTGETNITQPTTVSIDSLGEQTEDVHLEPAESTTVNYTFETTTGDNGEYTLTAETPNDSATTPVTVGKQGVLEAEITSINSSAKFGEDIVIEAEVINAGDEQIEGNVEFTDNIQASPFNEDLVELNAGEQTTLVVERETTLEDLEQQEVEITVNTETTESVETVSIRSPDAPEITSLDIQEDRTNDEITVVTDFEKGGVDISSATILLNAEFTAFSKVRTNETNVSDGGTWEETIDVDQLPRDGEYSVLAIVDDETDETAPATEFSASTVEVDTTAPSLQLGVTELGSEDNAELTIAGDEAFEVTSLEITDTEQNDVAPSLSGDLHQETVTKEFDDDGDTVFNITVEAEDDLGNSITETMVTSVTPYTIEEDQAEVSLPDDYTNLTLKTGAVTTESAEERAVTSSTSDSLPSGTTASENQIITGVVDVSDIGLTEENLNEAEIRLSTANLPEELTSEFDVDELQIMRSEDGEESYSPIETEFDSETNELVATVDGFSQHGIGVEDTEQPSIDETTVTPGTSINPDDAPVTVEFDYGPRGTNINLSATEFTVDGVSSDVVDTQLEPTSGEVIVDSVTDGDEITVELLLVDEAGNENTDSVTITVEDSSTDDDNGSDDTNGGSGGSSGGSSGGGGGGGGSGSGVPSPLPTQFPDDASVNERTQDRISDGESISVSQPGNFLANPVVNQVTFNQGGLEGEIETRDFDRVPSEAGTPPGDVYSVTQILVPPEYADIDSTVTFDLMNAKSSPVDVADIDRDTLNVWHRSDSTGEWEQLDTRVVEDSEEHLLVEATVDSYSYFAVTNAVSSDGEGPSEVEGADDSAESVDDEIPGFSVMGAIFALIVGVFVLKKKSARVR